MKGFIYKITNEINNRQYVGISEKTWKDKINEAIEKSPLLAKDFQEFGKSKFKMELVYETNIKDKHELRETLESKFWKYIGTIDFPEYNGEDQLNKEVNARLRHLTENYYNELNIILLRSLIPKFKEGQDQALQNWKIQFEMFVKQFQNPIIDPQVLFILNNDLPTLVEKFISPMTGN